ncbi:type II secretion system protein [Alishewanella longhuensis]
MIVIIILGLLAAVALPRFISATKDAEEVSVEAMASAFASAVMLTRSQWELAGRPAGQVRVDSTLIAVGANGYPTGGGLPQAMSAAQCLVGIRQYYAKPAPCHYFCQY